MTNVELLKTMTQRNNLLRQENERLKSQLAITNADMEYMAMMTDVDLEEGDDEDEQEI